MELQVKNVNQGLSEGLNWLRVAGIEESSRNGPVIVSREPVMTIYEYPRERVLFSPERDANPFFHLFEALWMLAGRNDIAWPAKFVKRMMDFSDDGVVQHGAYGYRWRNWFGYDQLELIAKELLKNPESRRCVLTMWDGEHDLDYAVTPGSKDAPCNTQIYFDARDGRLNMTVTCRSNDIWWGAYGANAVHFSMLQEYMAHWAKLEVGVYRQFSNNFHIYTSVVPREQFYHYAADACDNDYYTCEGIKPMLLIDPNNGVEAWNKELLLFLEDPLRENYAWQDPFFAFVAVPMYQAWFNHKQKISSKIEFMANDWRCAAQLWLARRSKQAANARG